MLSLPSMAGRQLETRIGLARAQAESGPILDPFDYPDLVAVIVVFLVAFGAGVGCGSVAWVVFETPSYTVLE